jgi:hypothetical protein
MYEPPLSEKRIAELAAFGLTPEDVATEPVQVWPCCVRAVELFAHMRTQWRVGMGGATGLDYGVMYRRMDRMGLDPDEYDALEDDMRVMEAAALGAMHDNKDAA